MEFLKDEKGKLSTARTLCTAWLSFTAFYVALFPAATTGVLSLFATVAVSLIAWAGGPRIAEYIGPQVGKVADAIRQAVNRRDAKDGIEVTK